MDAKENAHGGQGRGREVLPGESELNETHGNHDVAPARMPEPSFAAMQAYVDAGYALIRLQRHNKVPLDKNWTQIQANPADVLTKARAQGLNVGVRLRVTDLVIDADPRNYPEGRDCLAELVRDAGLTLDAYPHVLTGGGGHHYYLHKPEGLAIVGEIKQYPGVEFKTHGRQVVAAGSVHPSGKHYEDEFARVSLVHVPDAPESLLKLIQRQPRELDVQQHGARWGELTPEMLAQNLAMLDPGDFREHDHWRDLMMACHHATAGNGCNEFIEWCTDDPEYADDADEIASRWNSCHERATSGRPITVEHLFKLLISRGHRPIDRNSAKYDFGLVSADGEPLPLQRMGNGVPKPNYPNCVKLLRHLNDKLGLVFDEFGRDAHLVAPELPWSMDVGRRIDDHVVRRIRQYLVEITDLNWNKDDVVEAVLTLARENTVHPVRDFLANLTWDGVPRIDSLLVKYAGADDNPYVRAIGAKALIAAVRRVRQPGCKFDNVIVLEGDQGCGKSSFVRLLSPNVEWFSDSPIGNTESKDAPLSLEGRWIIELGEMSVLSKSGVEALKAFVSSSIDHVRRPYGRLHEELRRQCIFIGTTNQGTYLKDQTGNRRFWPVKVGTIDLDALVADRDQLWAEAAQREAAGEALLLPQELWAYASLEQEERVAEDPWVDILRTYLDAPRQQPWDEVGATQPLDRIHGSTLLTDVLGIRASEQRADHSQRLKVVMTKYLGWQYKGNVRVDGRQGKGYVRPEVTQDDQGSPEKA